MRINNFRGDLTVSAEKEALLMAPLEAEKLYSVAHSNM